MPIFRATVNRVQRFVNAGTNTVTSRASEKSEDILIHNGGGVSFVSSFGLWHRLRKLPRSAGYNIKFVDGSYLKNKKWEGNTKLLILPGGRARPFYDAFGTTWKQGDGSSTSREIEQEGIVNQRIKNFVANGGHYLGFCAGAYYAAAQTIFALGTPLEIQDEGALCFFPGSAAGPVYDTENFSYHSRTGAHPMKITWRSDSVQTEPSGFVYYNGGCSFYGSPESFVTLARYDDIDGQPPAVIKCNTTQGSVVLSGVHFEVPHYFLPGLKFSNPNFYALLKKYEQFQLDSLDNLLAALGIPEVAPEGSAYRKKEKISDHKMILFQRSNPKSDVIKKVNALTNAEFLKEYKNKRPFVARSPVKDDLSIDSLMARFGDREALFYKFHVNQNFLKEKVTGCNVADAIELIRSNKDVNIKYYILRQSVARYFPELIQDIGSPDWFKLPGDAETNLWVSEPGNITALHRDATDNFLIQIEGEKEVILFPPDSESIHVNNPFTGGRYNFCQTKFVEMSGGHSAKNGYRVILYPGQLLYIPQNWWHQVNTNSLSVSVNCFWPTDLVPVTCRDYVTDFQATKLHSGLYPEAVSQLINESTYDNSLEIADKLISMGYPQLSILLSALYMEEMMRHLLSVFLPECDARQMRLTELNDVLASLSDETLHLSLFKEKLTQWQLLVNEVKKDNAQVKVDKVFARDMLDITKRYFTVAHEKIEAEEYSSARCMLK
jgi:glutamine amidotransferase-like uncharacterized protein/ribosomal protein L16 Arg81 hydroxylase